MSVVDQGRGKILGRILVQLSGHNRESRSSPGSHLSVGSWINRRGHVLVQVSEFILGLESIFLKKNIFYFLAKNRRYFLKNIFHSPTK